MLALKDFTLGSKGVTRGLGGVAMLDLLGEACENH